VEDVEAGAGGGAAAARCARMAQGMGAEAGRGWPGRGAARVAPAPWWYGTACRYRHCDGGGATRD
jgi:hypothetical protein